MATTGGGPSRRSHTKSRKGCKTCKRRHIRCDETFPQCRNCTKHQVRCDYMDNVQAEETQREPAVPDLQYPQEIEATLDRWQRSGECSLANFSIDLHAQGHHYTKNDLRLMYYALWSASHPESNEFTVWTGKIPKFLMAANSQPFLVHAILAFGSSTLAWEQQSTDSKNLAYYHGGIALQGLQNAISMFSRENADAVLAASILLSWQANEWRSWSSLVSGIRTVINNMQHWKGESYLADIMVEQERSIPLNFPGFVPPQFNDEPRANRSAALRQISEHIENLVNYLCLREEEATWVEQLKDYIQQLLGLRLANSPEEQFNHLYTFRKWLFCIPTTLLKPDTRDYQNLIVLAYYYATALQLEPLYPNVGASFCSTIVVKPLEEIFKSFHALQQSPAYANQHTNVLLSLLHYPKSALAAYNERKQLPSAPQTTSPHRLHSTASHSRLATPSFDRATDLTSTYDDFYRLSSHDSPSSAAMRRQMSTVSSIGLGTPYLELSGFGWDDASSSAAGSSAATPHHSRHSSSYTLLSQDSGFGADDYYFEPRVAGSLDFSKAAFADPKVAPGPPGQPLAPPALDFATQFVGTPLWE